MFLSIIIRLIMTESHPEFRLVNPLEAAQRAADRGLLDVVQAYTTFGNIDTTTSLRLSAQAARMAARGRWTNEELFRTSAYEELADFLSQKMTQTPTSVPK